MGAGTRSSVGVWPQCGTHMARTNGVTVADAVAAGAASAAFLSRSVDGPASVDKQVSARHSTSLLCSSCLSSFTRTRHSSIMNFIEQLPRGFMGFSRTTLIGLGAILSDLIAVNRVAFKPGFLYTGLLQTRLLCAACHPTTPSSDSPTPHTRMEGCSHPTAATGPFKTTDRPHPTRYRAIRAPAERFLSWLPLRPASRDWRHMAIPS